MEMRDVGISVIKEAPYNPRTMSPEVMNNLMNSIMEFGYYTPLVVNKHTMHVVGGNQRLQALRNLGYEMVQVIFVNLKLEQEKALNIALNKIGGEWDHLKLADLIQELHNIPEFDEGLTGFSNSEISRILDESAISLEEFFDEELELERASTPVTKPGDVIELGRHKIICSDTALPETIERLLGGEKIGLVHQDNPYGVLYDANKRPTSKSRMRNPRWKPIANDQLTGKEHVEWAIGIMKLLKPYLIEGCPIYLWDGFRNFGPLTQALAEMGIHVSNVITWMKPNPSPSFSDYWFQSEFLLYCWLEGAGPHRWFGPAMNSNIWQVERDEASGIFHPTAKPVELARRVIRNSSTRGDIVFDGCMGAGFNLMASEQLGRIFRGVEIEPGYCDVVVRRFARAFGADKLSPEIREKYLKKEGSS